MAYEEAVDDEVDAIALAEFDGKRAVPDELCGPDCVSVGSIRVNNREIEVVEDEVDSESVLSIKVNARDTDVVELVETTVVADGTAE